MERRYQKHYTVAEARALLPRIRQWLSQLHALRNELEECDRVVSELIQQGHDVGGRRVNRIVGGMGDIKALVDEFRQRDIQIKDLDRGLIDFPAIIGGKEVFLCWEKDEDDIEYWHDLDTGYAGREKLL
jgi:hypothetical protein